MGPSIGRARSSGRWPASVPASRFRRGWRSCRAPTSRPMPRRTTPRWAWSSRSPTDQSTMVKMLTNSKALALGYATLYQGQSATGVSPGRPRTPGSTTAISPTSRGPASSRARRTVSFEPTTATSPAFLVTQRDILQQAQLHNFPARVTGGASSTSGPRPSPITRPRQLDRRRPGPADHLRLDRPDRHGRSPSPRPWAGASIRPELPGPETTRSILGGAPPPPPTRSATTSSSAPTRSSPSRRSAPEPSIGSHAYVANSTLPAGTVVPANAIIINNKHAGTVQW